MKSIICSVLISFFLATVLKFSNTNALRINSTTQNQINRLFDVQESIGSNITLTSNSTLGTGAFGFVLAGKTNDGTSVAIKVTSIAELDSYTQEYHCYEKMNATTDKVCEKYGIPFIYHSGDFLSYKMMAMTMLYHDMYSLQCKFGLFSKDTILIIFRDMIKALKFVHSKGIIHQDIKGDNILIKGANIYLFDFNVCVDKKLQNHPRRDSDFIETLSILYKQDSAEYHDMLSLFSLMCNMAKMYTFYSPEVILNSDKEINEQKRQIKEELFAGMKYIELVEPYAEFCFDAIDAMREKRLPKYDYLYKIFDDALYAGRNRSERIVFEWLTPEEKAAALAESPPSIESIVFPKENNTY